jgi:spore coat protein A
VGPAAQYHLHDDLERRLGIPVGEPYDVPLIIRDAICAKNGELIYDNNSESGVYGDVILVNGVPWPNMRVYNRKYRLRFEVVGDAPTGPDGKIPNNDLPSQLNDNFDVTGLTAKDATVKRKFAFERKHGHWTVNGETWEDVIASDYRHTVRAAAGRRRRDLGAREQVGRLVPPDPHPPDRLQILDRDGKSPFAYERGPKDTVYLGENETVRVIMKFDDTRGRNEDQKIQQRTNPEAAILAPRTGRYMMHCHNLVHEDHDMMVQFEVLPRDGSDDPVPGDPWSPGREDKDPNEDAMVKLLKEGDC